jgi:predicted RecB family nuclease
MACRAGHSPLSGPARQTRLPMQNLGDGVMAAKITRHVLQSHLNCKYKSHLKLAGEQGIMSDYEALLSSNRQEVRKQAIGKILARHPEREVARDISLTAANLATGPSIVLDATLEDDRLSLVFDGLKRVDGPSKLGDLYYVPMLFHEGRDVGKEPRLLLELYGLMLSEIQGRTPTNGVVFHGQECKPTKIRLNPDVRKAERLLREVKEMTSTESPPRLILNDHCQICEFRQRCHQQAMQEDNLSLLRGIGEKEIKGYARKGIFTVYQLSHTFRARRHHKRTKQAPRPHSFALQALALRESKIYIDGTPRIQESGTHVYIDIEGLPDENFYYLIGVLIDDGSTQQSYSFWANNEQDQGHISAQFVRLLLPYSDYTVYHFGNYEMKALKRLRSLIPDELQQTLTEIQRRAVNVLSVIHSHVYFPTLSNTLKNIAGYLGVHWTDEGASGVQSIVWRKQWELTHNTSLQDRLIRYNIEDCVALRSITEVIISVEKSVSQEGAAENTKRPDIVNTSELQRSIGRSHRFCTISFVFPELDFVNKCAYFDYQREKVFVRSNNELRRISRRKTIGKTNNLKPNTCIKLECRKCPSCGSRSIEQGKRISRAIADLKFSNTGVKRWITKYDARWY